MSIQYKGRTIEYIASDLDGTLLYGEGHRLDDETYELISKCMDQGIHFIVASGRTIENERKVMEPIKDRISYIGGSGTISVHKDTIVSYHLIEKEDARKIFDVANSIEHCYLFVCTKNGVYVNSKYPLFYDHLNNNVGFPVQYIEDIHSILDEPIEKISTFYEEGSSLVAPIFQKELPHYNVCTSGPQWLDFLDLDVNKGTTLKKLLEHLDIDVNNGIAFGDQENDIQMIQTAGIGYCMKTGVEKSKQVADHVIESPKEILRDLLKTSGY